MREVQSSESSLLTLVSILKLLAEIALLAFLGQWVLALLTGPKRDQNLFYQVLQVLTKPFVRGARLVTPRIVLDRHVPLVAFLLLLSVWVGATIAKISICVEIGVQLCK